MRIDRESLFGVEGVDGWDAPWKVEAVLSNEITYHPRVDQGTHPLCVDCRNSPATHGYRVTFRTRDGRVETAVVRDRCEADQHKARRRG